MTTTRVSRSLRVLFLGLAGSMAFFPAWGGEYDKVSPGISIDYSYSTGNSFVPFQNSSGNIQGADTKGLFGVGLVFPVRLGEAFSNSLSNFLLTPTLAMHYGTVNEGQNFSNMTFYSAGGSEVSVQNGASSRKTTTTELSFVVPLRWYPANNAVYGGFWVEAGPGIVRSNKSVDLTVSGFVESSQSSLDESSTIVSNVKVIEYGLGWTTIYAKSQSTFGLFFQSAPSNSGVSNQMRVGLQWTF
jgi:hypothetical protein